MQFPSVFLRNLRPLSEGSYNRIVLSSAHLQKQKADSLIGRQVMSYRVERAIGRGGMGAVYEAVDPTTGRRAALKVLLPEWSSNQQALLRFINEARAVAQVRHLGLVEFLGHGSFSDGTAYILMEFLPGESLKAKLDRQREQGQRLSIRQAIEIGQRVAGALSSVHARGIVHRDLKPANILLVPMGPDGSEQAKIVDFGIAKLDTDEGTSVARTTVGRFLGTALYASPEQCEMSGDVGSASDVYSLGVTMFEMLTGKPPFWADKPGIVLAQHQFQAPPDLAKLAPEVPDPLCELVHAMLVKEPSKRPTMAYIEQRLSRLLVEGGALRRSGTRRRLRLGMLVGGLCFLTILVAVFKWRQPDKRDRMITPAGSSVRDASGARSSLLQELSAAESPSPSSAPASQAPPFVHRHSLKTSPVSQSVPVPPSRGKPIAPSGTKTDKRIPHKPSSIQKDKAKATESPPQVQPSRNSNLRDDPDDVSR